MTPRPLWTVIGVIVANLTLFILLTSLPAFQDLHHHWIFPLLAGLFIAEWALAGGLLPWEGPGWLDLGAARAAILSLLAFLMLMGIVRHWTILHCVGRCSLKLGESAIMAGLAFLLQSRRADPFWTKARARAAALGCLLWAGWLFPCGLLGRQTYDPALVRRLDWPFLALAALLLVGGWKRPAARACGLAIPCLVLARRAGAENAVILLAIPIVLAFLWLAGRLEGASGTP